MSRWSTRRRHSEAQAQPDEQEEQRHTSGDEAQGEGEPQREQADPTGADCTLEAIDDVLAEASASEALRAQAELDAAREQWDKTWSGSVEEDRAEREYEELMVRYAHLIESGQVQASELHGGWGSCIC